MPECGGSDQPSDESREAGTVVGYGLALAVSDVSGSNGVRK